MDQNSIQIIEKPCRVYKKKMEIGIGFKDFETGERSNIFLNPKTTSEIVLTQDPSSISTSIFKLNPNLEIISFNNGMPFFSMIQIDNIPKILKNEELFTKISSYKRRKLAWIFCKAVCSNRIKIISRLNETRKNQEVNEILSKMRELDRKLINHKNHPQEMMGLEGNIAKMFYYCLGNFNDLFKVSRDRQSQDIVNVLINYAHTILRNKIKNRLLYHSINPYHSFLHNNDRNQEFLVFDFAEFWIAYVDKIIFYSLEKGIIKKDDVNKEGRLTQSACKKMIYLVYKRITNEKIDKKIKEFIGYLKGENRFSWKSSHKITKNINQKFKKN